MPDFGFITSSDLRESLERDYQELEKAFGAGAWKSVQVLSGSIVEAVLVDFLAATPNASRVSKDPLRMDLAELIDICHAEGVLTPRTTDLCSVIRSYRNLIHPGRAIRLGEEPPTDGSARVSVALIDLIVADVVRFRQENFGFTASQILLKIERDPNCLPILRHLLDDVQQSEQDKLVLHVLPERYIELAEQSGGESPALATLRKAYLTAKAVASESALKEAALDYVRVLKEGSSNLVARYDEAFFRATDMKYVPEAQRALVKQHLISTIGIIDESEKLARIRGIEDYLEVKDVNDWLIQLVRAIISKTAPQELRNEVRSYVFGASLFMSAEMNKEIGKKLELLAKGMRQQERIEDAEEVERIRLDLDFSF